MLTVENTANSPSVATHFFPRFIFIVVPALSFIFGQETFLPEYVTYFRESDMKIVKVHLRTCENL